MLNYQDFHYYIKSGDELTMSQSPKFILSIPNDNIEFSTVLYGLYNQSNSIIDSAYAGDMGQLTPTNASIPTYRLPLTFNSYYIDEDASYLGDVVVDTSNAHYAYINYVFPSGSTTTNFAKSSDVSVWFYTTSTASSHQTNLDIKQVDVSSNGFYISYKGIKTNNGANSDTLAYGIDYIKGLNISLPSTITDVFPSITYQSKIMMQPISVGLVETETLSVFNESNDTLTVNNIQIIDSDYDIKFSIKNNDQTNFRLFSINTATTAIDWSYNQTISLVQTSDLTNVKVNIGFISDEEGTYEETLYMYIVNKTSGTEYLLSTFTLFGEAVGEDTRYRTLFSNFGIPDPINYESIFKDSDINQQSSNYDLVNKKSKELFLSYSEIFPYIGTYKALINAINFLGYNDIIFKEWYKIKAADSVNSPLYTSYEVAYNNISPENTILSVNLNERVNLIKLNRLSMVYKLNKETGLLDEYDIPEVEDVYEYRNDEVIAKLISLKNWLEKNIISLNCKIIELSGEGIYFYKYNEQMYGTVVQNLDWINKKTLHVYLSDISTELLDGSANIEINIDERNIPLYELGNYNILSMTSPIVKNTSTNAISNIDLDASMNLIDTSNIYVAYSNTFELPNNIESVNFKVNVDTSSAIINSDGPIATNQSIWIYDNKIRFFNETINNVTLSHNPTVIIQKGYLRNPNKNWNNNIEYSIYLSTNNSYIIEKFTDTSTISQRLTSKDYIILNVNTADAYLKYSENNKFDLPLFLIKGYEVGNEIDVNNTFINNVEYILDINTGKIAIEDSSNNKTSYINFKYDNEQEQQIYASFEYKTERDDILDLSVFVNYDPSADIDDDPSNASVITKTIKVNNIGKYNIYTRGYDEYNNMFTIKNKYKCNVYMTNPSISLYTQNDNTNNDTNGNFYNNNVIGISTINGVNASYILNLFSGNSSAEVFPLYSNNLSPVFFKDYLLYDISTYKDSEDNYIIKYPTISYAVNTPDIGDTAMLENIVDSFNHLGTSTVGDNHIFTFNRRGIFQSNYFFNFGGNNNYNRANIILYDSIYNYVYFENSGYVNYDGSIYTYYSDTSTNSNLLNTALNDTSTNKAIKIYFENVAEYGISSISKGSDDYTIVAVLDSSSISACRGGSPFKYGQKLRLNFLKNSYKMSATFTFVRYNNMTKSLTLKSLNNFDILNLTGLTTATISIAHAHLDYTKYNMLVDSVEEGDNGYTDLVINSNYRNLFNFIDNTFGISYQSFNYNTPLYDWMSYDTSVLDPSGNVIYNVPAIIQYVDVYDAKKPVFVPDNYWGSSFPWNSENYFDASTPYYLLSEQRGPYAIINDNIKVYAAASSHKEIKPIYHYEIPITISKNTPIVVDAVYYNNGVIVDDTVLNGKYCYWNVSNTNSNNKTSTRYIVKNKALFLTAKDKGIYNVTNYLYDNYGNMVITNADSKFLVN